MKTKKLKAVFRKSMHGYNKKDVNDYIVRLSRDFFEKEQRLKLELRKAETDALLSEAETDMIFKLREENERLSDTVEELRNANDELNRKLSEAAVSDAVEPAATLAGAMSVDLFAEGFSAISYGDSIAEFRCAAEKIRAKIRAAKDTDPNELMDSIDCEISKIERLLYK